MSAELERIFPALASDGYVVVSPETTADNWIAWAAGESHRWWEPGVYWPIQPGDDLAALIRSACSRHWATRSATTTDSKLGASAWRSMPTTSAIGRTPLGNSRTVGGRASSARRLTSFTGARTHSSVIPYGEVRAIMKQAIARASENADVD